LRLSPGVRALRDSSPKPKSTDRRQAPVPARVTISMRGWPSPSALSEFGSMMTCAI